MFSLESSQSSRASSASPKTKDQEDHQEIQLRFTTGNRLSSWARLPQWRQKRPGDFLLAFSHREGSWLAVPPTHLKEHSWPSGPQWKEKKDKVSRVPPQSISLPLESPLTWPWCLLQLSARPDANEIALWSLWEPTARSAPWETAAPTCQGYWGLHIQDINYMWSQEKSIGNPDLFLQYLTWQV